MYQMISKLKEPSKIPSSTLRLPYSERLPRIVFQKPGEKMLTELRGAEKNDDSGTRLSLLDPVCTGMQKEMT